MLWSRNLDASNPQRVVVREFADATSSYNRVMLTGRLREGGHKPKSKREGQKPFGYRQGEPEIIEYTRRPRDERLSFRQIATP